MICIFLINSCNFGDKFPLTIDDIDTLTIYNEYQAKLIDKEKPNDIHTDTIISPDTSKIAELQDRIPVDQKKWTICTGVFREKQNAILMFRQLAKELNTHFIVRDSLFFVTIGYFSNKDSATAFKEAKSLSEAHIIKLKPNESLLKELPD